MTLQLLMLSASIAFAVGFMPQAYQVMKQGHAQGTSIGSVILFLYGDIACMFSILNGYGAPELLINHTAGAICLLTILRYKIWPTSKI